ncbi:hypothetical protein AAFN86_28255 [Roseomonas sp. CAU 1739]|uniref:hypothetical protein n=1 Tax=Roseomonas sp. CAU 1739 TaxID=3140364 RepID=UPI00325B766E
MTDFLWKPGSWAAMFGSSDLNSLANGSTAFSSTTAPQIDTTSTLELYLQAEFVGGSISPTNAADVVFILVPRDSANAAYVDGEATSTVANQPVWMQYPHAIIGLRTKATQAQLAMSPLIMLPPNRYKAMLLNRAGVALASSGNQVNARLVTEKGV